MTIAAAAGFLFDPLVTPPAILAGGLAYFRGRSGPVIALGIFLGVHLLATWIDYQVLDAHAPYVEMSARTFGPRAIAFALVATAGWLALRLLDRPRR